MAWRARLIISFIGVLLLIFVIRSVRSKRLKEEYALLWIFMSVVLVVAPLLIDLIDTVSFAIGIDYPPALLIVVTLLCFVLIFFQMSVTISRFSEQIRKLSQELALTNRRLRELEGQGVINQATEQD